MANLQRRKSISETRIAGLYDLSETIGKGHFAIVKVAKHVFTGERVAVKIIDKTKLDPISNEHLFQEVRCMKLVQHPNIVRLYEVIDTQTKLFLILELGDYDLFDKILRTSERGMDEKEAQRHFWQIVNAISYCHRLHVVHRDLKPENVVFMEKLQMVKLTDFGFSNLFTPGQTLDTSCGSLAYSAPEILLGDAYDAPAVDVWSLGVILYMMVCGRLPFQEVSDSETLTKILDCSYPLPSHLSPGCIDVIRRLLVRDPTQRATLHELMTFSWVQAGDYGHANILPLVSRAIVPDETHDHVIEQMVEGHIASADEICKAVDSDDYSYITATYYLLLEGHFRQERLEKAQALMLSKQEKSLTYSHSNPDLEPRLLESINDAIPRPNLGDRALLPISTNIIPPPIINDGIHPSSSGGVARPKLWRQRTISIVREESSENEDEPSMIDISVHYIMSRSASPVQILPTVSNRSLSRNASPQTSRFFSASRKVSPAILPDAPCRVGSSHTRSSAGSSRSPSPATSDDPNRTGMAIRYTSLPCVAPSRHMSSRGSSPHLLSGICEESGLEGSPEPPLYPCHSSLDKETKFSSFIDGVSGGGGNGEFKDTSSTSAVSRRADFAATGRSLTYSSIRAIRQRRIVASAEHLNAICALAPSSLTGAAASSSSSSNFVDVRRRGSTSSATIPTTSRRSASCSSSGETSGDDETSRRHSAVVISTFCRLGGEKTSTFRHRRRSDEDDDDDDIHNTASSGHVTTCNVDVGSSRVSDTGHHRSTASNDGSKIGCTAMAMAANAVTSFFQTGQFVVVKNLSSSSASALNPSTVKDTSKMVNDENAVVTTERRASFDSSASSSKIVVAVKNVDNSCRAVAVDV